MLVQNIMSNNVTRCNMSDSLEIAIQEMKEYDVGFIPIVDTQNKLVNVVTDRDLLLHTTKEHRPFSSQTCQDISNHRSLLTCNASDDVMDVMKTMKKEQIHRVPVVDGEDRVLGVIGLSDIVENTEQNNSSKIPPRETLDTVKGIFAH